MALRTIVCETCGHHHETKRGNTKYCRVCQLVRNLEFLATQQHKCVSCEQKYAPIEMLSKDFRLCGKCRKAPSRNDTEGTCGFCGEEVKDLLHPDVHICRKCSTDPAKRTKMFKALLIKQNQQIQANETA